MPITARLAAASARAYGMFRIMTAAVVDPFFNYVVALLHGDGTNGAQNNTFLDSSTNNFTITRNGNTTQGSFSPFSQTGWSNYFDGSSYITTPDSTAFTLGASDFTIECWVMTFDTGPKYILGQLNSSFTTSSVSFYMQGGVSQTIQAYVTSGGNYYGIQTAAGLLPSGKWTHIAFVRDGTTLRLYVNGTQQGSSSTISTLSVQDSTNAFSVGRAGEYVTNPWNGYISNVRVVKGTCLYPSGTTFTPSTTPLTAVSGTSLLTCQSNRFIDNSTNALPFTASGSPSVQPFSPFNPTSAWSASSNGGSGYFDGSGDYLKAASNAAFGYGTGDFTIELWFYPTVIAAGNHLIDQRPAAGSYVVPTIYFGTSSLLYYVNGAIRITGAALTANQWHHIAVCRASGSTRLFLNGTQTGSTYADTNNYITSPVTIFNDGTGVGAYSTGYCGDLRIINGTALYTTTFTPPTAPLTSVANTQLLLNYTNGGIYDNAAVADYETVGNAQVSTAVVKYGTGSMKFDGTGDYLYSFSNVMALGTGDWTIEGWVYTASGTRGIMQISDTAGGLKTTFTTGPAIFLNSSRYLSFAVGSVSVVGTNPAPSNSWNHFALSKSSGSIKLFLNGTQEGSTVTDTTNLTGTYICVGGYYDTTLLLNGYIDDFRITRGVGRYQYNFTPPTAAFPNIGGTVTLTADPYFNSTALLLPGNGTNGAQNNTFIDSSANALTITRNGNSTQGSASPYSQTGWSTYVTGGAKLTTPANAALSMGTGEFTWECWVNIPATSGYQALIDSRSATLTDGFFFGLTTGASTLSVVTNAVALTSTVSVPLNQWTHVALVRASGTVTIYINGTSAGSLVTAFNLSNNVITIGDHTGGTNPTTGYISNVRVTKGGALYTSNFTPNTSALTTTVSAGTVSLLTCQSNRFVDNSANAFALTPATSPTIQPFSPFAPTAAYSTGSIGGAAYFDGTGDYLSVANSAVLNLGSNNFTIEAWYYAAGGSTEYLVSKGTTGGANSEFYISVTSARIVNFAYSVTGSSNTIISTSPNTITANAWNHVAVTRSGNTYYVFINGAQVATGSITATIKVGTAAMQVGALNSGSLITGYLADLRIVNGTAVYTSAFTPPTSALTAITNTAFLLSATNAGIYDATAKNICETLGNAQISTTQSKFGGSSMYFDGNGDYLAFKRTQPLFFGTGDYTIEFWFYNSAAQKTVSALFAFHTGATTYFAVYNNTTLYPNVLNVDDGSGTPPIIGTTTLVTGQWYHCALSRYNGNTKLFLNGVQEGSTWVTTTAPSASGTSFRVAAAGTVTNIFTGYIDDFRVTTGVARYTSNFIPPTSAYLTQ